MALSKSAIAKSLGSLIKKLRNEASEKMTQGQFGCKVLDRPEEDERACQAWVSRVELGNFSTQITDKILIKMAEVLNVKPDKLLELWADYNNAIDNDELKGDGQGLSLPQQTQRTFPKLQGYFDSFLAVTPTEDPEVMADILSRAIKYLRSFNEEK